MIEDVKEFHDKFGVGVEVDRDRGEFILSEEAWEFRRKFIREEADEFNVAWVEGDAVKKFDSLLDLVYVALGTAVMMGITPEQWNRGFSVVHSCNMAKVRATSDEQSKRGTKLDVIKPEGWTGPEERLREILFTRGDASCGQQ